MVGVCELATAPTMVAIGGAKARRLPPPIEREASSLAGQVTTRQRPLRISARGVRNFPECIPRRWAQPARNGIAAGGITLAHARHANARLSATRLSKDG